MTMMNPIGKQKILIVEDDPGIREIVRLYLESNGYEAIEAADGETANRLFQDRTPDLVILDILLPDTNGIDLCMEWNRFSDVPILFLSSRQEDGEIIAGLKAGGVDYVTKPFNPSVLIARVEANLRRSAARQGAAADSGIIRHGDLELDLNTRELRVNGQAVPLYAKEWKLLRYLLQHPNHVFSADELYEQVWGEHSIGSEATIMVHISNLRKKIEPDSRTPRYIVTVKGLGYKFHSKIGK
ncbi:response regulator transcription factor [Cohnella caldifontis]|uniref:response regulator transcription factor n=1 Tax=Cohnella caldifontis TaxID=3027471 RepID=UPI0023EC3306|nr:response regulator transcription factor [Cohnella sp. YIM B05605]